MSRIGLSGMSGLPGLAEEQGNPVVSPGSQHRVRLLDRGQATRRSAVRPFTTRWWPAIAAAVAVAAVVAVVIGVTVPGGRSYGGDGRSPRGQTTGSGPSTADRLSLARNVQCQTPTPGAVSRAQLQAFHAVTAVSCVQDARSISGAGKWLVSIRRVATSGVPALQAALERPDAKPSHSFCPALAYLPMPLVLVDAAGHTLVPSPPLGSCHLPEQAYLRALDHVTWKPVSVHRIRRIGAS
jgi:hypothetical protein